MENRRMCKGFMSLDFLFPFLIEPLTFRHNFMWNLQRRLKIDVLSCFLNRLYLGRGSSPIIEKLSVLIGARCRVVASTGIITDICLLVSSLFLFCWDHYIICSFRFVFWYKYIFRFSDLLLKHYE